MSRIKELSKAKNPDPRTSLAAMLRDSKPVRITAEKLRREQKQT